MLPLQVVREEVSAALSALGGLANLSAHLRREATEHQEVISKVAAVPLASTLMASGELTAQLQHVYSGGAAHAAATTPGGSAGILQTLGKHRQEDEVKDEAVALLEEQLRMRDEDFVAFGKAMEGLSDLTLRLARDASLATVDMA